MYISSTYHFLKFLVCEFAFVSNQLCLFYLSNLCLQCSVCSFAVFLLLPTEFPHVFTALSTVFHSINSPNSSLLSHFVLPVLFLPYQSFQLYLSFLKVSLNFS